MTREHKKYIQVLFTDGTTWEIPLRALAEQRAEKYALMDARNRVMGGWV